MSKKQIDWEKMKAFRDESVERLRKSREKLIKQTEEALAKWEKWKGGIEQ